MSIPKTMKALVVYSKDEYKLVTDFPAPECGLEDIIIKAEVCGICTGDLKCQHGDFKAAITF
jgi:L-iditol 2-dehydrogenase